MAKIEAFQDIKERPIELISPMPTPDGTTPVDQKVFRDIPDQPVEKLSGEVSQPVQEARDNVFRGQVPTNPLERGFSPSV